VCSTYARHRLSLPLFVLSVWRCLDEMRSSHSRYSCRDGSYQGRSSSNNTKRKREIFHVAGGKGGTCLACSRHVHTYKLCMTFYSPRHVRSRLLLLRPPSHYSGSSRLPLARRVDSDLSENCARLWFQSLWFCFSLPLDTHALLDSVWRMLGLDVSEPPLSPAREWVWERPLGPG